MYLNCSDGFASRPLPDLIQTIADQVSAADRCGISQEHHELLARLILSDVQIEMAIRSAAHDREMATRLR